MLVKHLSFRIHGWSRIGFQQLAAANTSCGISKFDIPQSVHILNRNFSVPASTKQKLEEGSNEDSESDLKEAGNATVQIGHKPAESEKESSAERQVRRRMSGHRTMYGQMMKEAEPEDEEAVLEYFVRKAQDSMAENDESIEYGVVEVDKKLFFRMVDLWIQDAGEVRRGHREFIQVALNNMERFNVQHEPIAYLKILECYPQSTHTGLQRNTWFMAVWQDKILDHEIGGHLVSMMNKYNVVPNDEFYDVFTRLFGKFSRATAAMRALLFWYPRQTQFITFPVSEKKLETMTRAEVAVHALQQAYPTLNAHYQRFETEASNSVESKPNSTDQELNSIISIQTRDQRELLENHDIASPLFVEGPNVIYFKNRQVQYYVLRTDPVEKKEATQSHQLLTDKEWWMKFYGKDFDSRKTLNKNLTVYSTESFLPVINMDDDLSTRKQMVDRNQIKEVTGDVPMVEGKVYGIAATDLKSIEALRSWIYGLESSNPVLSRLTILFNEKRSFLSEGYKARKAK